jgi:hypothetical protein
MTSTTDANLGTQQKSGRINPKVAMTSPERQLEEELLEKFRGLKYEHRADICDRDTLEHTQQHDE